MWGVGAGAGPVAGRVAAGAAVRASHRLQLALPAGARAATVGVGGRCRAAGPAERPHAAVVTVRTSLAGKDVEPVPAV